MQLRKNYGSVNVDFESVSGVKLKFTLSKGTDAAPSSLDALGYLAGNDPKDDVAVAMNQEIKNGGFPEGEAWS